MKHLVVENYKSHPKFPSPKQALEIDQALLASFETRYGSQRSSLSKSDYEASRACLTEIFEGLISQSSDSILTLFLKELELEILNLMDGDWRFRKIVKANNADSKKAQSLEEQKFFFGQLSDAAVKEILEAAHSSVNEFRIRASQGKLKRSDLSLNSGPIARKISRIVDREFRRLGIFKAVSEYIGIPYNFVGLSLELSVEGSTWWKDSLGNENAPKTMYAHLDESIFAPKSIVYLSDVSSSNGPTSLFAGAYLAISNGTLQDLVGRVVGNVGSSESSKLFEIYSKTYHQSVGSELFREHFMSLPEEIRFNSHFGWDVLPNSQLEEELSKNEIEMLGPPGRFIVFDGANLLHRGGLIEKGERLVLQVVFYRGSRLGMAFRAAFRIIWNGFKRL